MGTYLLRVPTPKGGVAHAKHGGGGLRARSLGVFWRRQIMLASSPLKLLLDLRMTFLPAIGAVNTVSHSGGASVSASAE